MTVTMDPASAPQCQSLGALTEIYEGMRVRVYRYDDSHALVRMGYGDATALLVIRPWFWTASEPTDPEYEGAMPPESAEAVRAWLSEEPGAVAEMDFASLLLWSCRRGPLDHRETSEEGYQEDVQRVGPRAFNRFLIREALQTWLQAGVRPHEVVRIEAIRAAGAGIRLSCGEVRALIAGMIDVVDPGDDPLLPEWPSDAFGAVEATQSARVVNQAN